MDNDVYLDKKKSMSMFSIIIKGILDTHHIQR